MAQINKVYNFKLDINGSYVVSRMSVRQNDSGSNIFIVQILNNKQPVDLTGYTPYFECLTPARTFIRDDGSQYSNLTVTDAIHGMIQYIIPDNVFATLGVINLAYFALETTVNSKTVRVTTGNFSFTVYGDAVEGNLPATDWNSQLQAMTDQINQIKSEYTTLDPGTYVTQTQFGTQNDSVASQLAEKVQYVPTINVLKSRNLSVGDVVKIDGFYSAITANGAHYRIISASDDGSGILLNNGLYANIYHDGYVNAKWFGAISSSPSDYRDTEIQRFFDYIKAGKAAYFDLGDQIIYLNQPHNISFASNGGGFTLNHTGGQLYFTLSTPGICLKIGADSPSAVSLSRVAIPNLNIKAQGSQTDALMLYTKGNAGSAFWNNRFGKLSVSVNHGHGVTIKNGVFESKFDFIRIDSQRSSLENPGDLIVANDIPLYLVNESGENIQSSLDFSYLDVWGGYHSIMTDQAGGASAPDFSAHEVHIFDSKMEGLYLQNQLNDFDRIDKLHMEFQGQASNPVYGCFWNGVGSIGSVDGGSNNLLGYVKNYNSYANRIFRVDNVTSPYNMPLKESLIYTDVRNGAISKIVNRDYADIKLNISSAGTLFCLIGGCPSKLKIVSGTWINITRNSDTATIYSAYQGVDNRVNHAQIGYSGVTGGITDLQTMDFTQTSKIMSWDNGNGNQTNVKIGFYDAASVSKQTVTGSKGNNAALASVITALKNLGLINDTTT